MLRSVFLNLITAQLSGFGLWCIFYVLCSRFAWVKRMDKTVVFLTLLVLPLNLIFSIGELFLAWYSGDEYLTYAFVNRSTGPYALTFWLSGVLPLLIPQLLWKKKWRNSRWFRLIMGFLMLLLPLSGFFVWMLVALGIYTNLSWQLISPWHYYVVLFLIFAGFNAPVFFVYTLVDDFRLKRKKD